LHFLRSHGRIFAVSSSMVIHITVSVVVANSFIWPEHGVKMAGVHL